MATPFDSKEGLTWADQWDYNNNSAGSADAPKDHKEPEKQKLAGKIKSAANTGMDKAKVAASTGAKKMKSGTNSGIQWIKDQYHKKTKK